MDKSVVLLNSGDYPSWMHDPKAQLFKSLLELGVRLPYTMVFKSQALKSDRDLLGSQLASALRDLEANEIKLCEHSAATIALRSTWNDLSPSISVGETRKTLVQNLINWLPPWKSPQTLLIDTTGFQSNESNDGEQRLTHLADSIVSALGPASTATSEVIVQFIPTCETGSFVSVCTRNPRGRQLGPAGYLFNHKTGPRPLAQADSPTLLRASSAVCEVVERYFGCVCRVDCLWDGSDITVLALHRVHAEEAVVLDVHKRTGSFAYFDLNAFVAGSPSRIRNKEHLNLCARGNSLGRRKTTGRAIFSMERANQFFDDLVLVQEDCTLDQVRHFPKLKGLISRRGAVTSHLSVLARSMAVCYLTGMTDLSIDEENRSATAGNMSLCEGDWLTIDEVDGALYLGRGEIADIQTQSEARAEVLTNAEIKRRHQVYVNADMTTRLEEGVRKGADGVGLCRSEHHLIDGAGLTEFRALFVVGADAVPAYRARVIARLRDQLAALLRVADGRPVHYRLIDVRLDELFALNEEGLRLLSESLELPYDVLSGRINALLTNGSISQHRGCRWSLTDPAFYQAQLEGTIDAVLEVCRDGISIDLKIIVPLVTTTYEISYLRAILDDLLTNKLQQKSNCDVRLGAMIETPRAALCASDIAQHCSVFCFGTNDLTESTWCVSRDTDGTLLQSYKSWGYLEQSPFVALDGEGVGRLLRRAIDDARLSNEDVRCYLCGEQANDVDSISAALDMGFDGVSCSPDMVQAAIVAAAQIADRQDMEGKIFVPIPYLRRVGRGTENAHSRITSYLMQGRRKDAQEVAYGWARRMTSHLSLPVSDIWKFFKRDLVSLFFGKKPGRRFGPGWNTKEVHSYALSLRHAGHPRVRYSVFPRTIAAQSRTRQLTPSSTDTWWREIDAEDHEAALEVFPQPDVDRLAFRAVYQSSLLDFEAGWGEAAELFWKDPGARPVITGRYVSTELPDLHFVPGVVTNTSSDSLMKIVDDFITSHGPDLLARCDALCDALGIEWVSVEGYYAPAEEQVLSVVDVDFSLDVAFY